MKQLYTIQNSLQFNHDEFEHKSHVIMMSEKTNKTKITELIKTYKWFLNLVDSKITNDVRIVKICKMHKNIAEKDYLFNLNLLLL